VREKISDSKPVFILSDEAVKLVVIDALTMYLTSKYFAG